MNIVKKSFSPYFKHKSPSCWLLGWHAYFIGSQKHRLKWNCDTTVALGEKSGGRTFHKNHECAGENAWKSTQNVLWNFTLKHKLLVVLQEKSTDQVRSLHPLGNTILLKVVANPSCRCNDITTDMWELWTAGRLGTMIICPKFQLSRHFAKKFKHVNLNRIYPQGTMNVNECSKFWHFIGFFFFF